MGKESPRRPISGEESRIRGLARQKPGEKMLRNGKVTWGGRIVGAALGLAVMLLAQAAGAAPGGFSGPGAGGKWLSGDFHQHTTLTDGSHSMPEVMQHEDAFGLDWWANSEHGGAFPRDGLSRFFDQLVPKPTFCGNPPAPVQDGHQGMWRWQSLLQYSFPGLLGQRQIYRNKRIALGLEWNVPSHEHCSVGIVAQDALPMARFEYLFDQNDADTSGGAGVYDLDPERHKSLVNDHAKAVNAVKWLQQNYRKTSWVVFAHPERKNKYTISDFRDFNNAAPDVAFGFEGLPGHQKNAKRGEYSVSSKTAGGGTYGGAGIYLAKVGGLWDALLGEGRHWWTFVSSDFHDTPADFWPGEYAKTWTLVPRKSRADQITLEDIVNGLRSGNSYCVHGDLINGLDFRAEYATAAATMGQELKIPRTKEGRRITLTIKFRSPTVNHHGDRPEVDHIDLIMGEVTGRMQPGTPEYHNDTNPSTRVVATFTRKDWEADRDGWNLIRHRMIVKDDVYFRLRGTNVPRQTPGKTDASGNPLPDPAANSEDFVWSDLWFYANPIFVKVINN